jgi:prephenate dehydratase
MKTVVYQGTQGSFSELAARSTLGNEIICIGKETFAAVFESLKNQEADTAVIPIENTLIGSIWENYDLLYSSSAQIVGEKTLRIEHCLLGLAGSSCEKLKKVYSHPKALDQCRDFFKAHAWIEPVVHFDTAGAAEEITKRNNPSEGAIASIKTATLYGLDVLKKGIEDNPHNFTRFLLLEEKVCPNSLEGNKCSFVFALKHKPGALAAVLNRCAEAKVNLTKMESRPMRGKPFEYLFHIDLEYDRDVDQLIECLQRETEMFRVLGCYKKENRHEL